mgnify:CR=1 FL=1
MSTSRRQAAIRRSPCATTGAKTSEKLSKAKSKPIWCWKSFCLRQTRLWQHRSNSSISTLNSQSRSRNKSQWLHALSARTSKKWTLAFYKPSLRHVDKTSRLKQLKNFSSQQNSKILMGSQSPLKLLKRENRRRWPYRDIRDWWKSYRIRIASATFWTFSSTSTWRASEKNTKNC